MACPGNVDSNFVAYINYYYSQFNASIAFNSWTLTKTTCHVVGIGSQCVTNNIGTIANINYVTGSASSYPEQLKILLIIPHSGILVTPTDCTTNAVPFDVVDTGDGPRTIGPIVLPAQPGWYVSVAAFDPINALVISQHTFWTPKCVG